VTSVPRKPVTIRDVATASEMSLPAVSQILNNKGAYRPETRERVITAAAKLGYRPNAYAQAMTKGRFRAVALLVPTEKSLGLVSSPLLLAAEEQLARHGHHLMVARLPDDQLSSEGQVPRILSSLMVDGLLIAYNAKIPARMIELMRHIPSVWIHSQQPDSAVYPDDAGAAREATLGLAALGHRRIAYACFTIFRGENPWHYSGNARREGYLAAMAEAGLAPQLWMPETRVLASERLAFARQCVADPDRPTAVVCSTPETANPLAMAAAQAGLTLPGALALVTFSQGPTSETGLAIATMLLPGEAMGTCAVDMLMAKLEGGKTPSQSMKLVLAPGETWTAPAAR